MSCKNCTYDLAGVRSDFCPSCGFKLPNAPARVWLLVMGIIYIVFSSGAVLGYSFVLSFMDGFFGIPETGWLEMYGGEALRGAWTFYYGAYIILELYCVLMGVMAVFYRNNLPKSGMLFLLAITEIIVRITLTIINIVSGTFSALVGASDGIFGNMMSIILIFSMIFIFIYPVLYIIGAMKNKAAYERIE